MINAEYILITACGLMLTAAWYKPSFYKNYLDIFVLFSLAIILIILAVYTLINRYLEFSDTYPIPDMWYAYILMAYVMRYLTSQLAKKLIEFESNKHKQ